MSQAQVEGLAPQLAVAAFGDGRRDLSAPGPRSRDLRPAVAAEADGALRRKTAQLTPPFKKQSLQASQG